MTASFERMGWEQTTEAFEPETPFLGTGFTSETSQRERGNGSAALAEQSWTPQVETPFLTEYQGEAPANLEVSLIGETLQELHDAQFDEAVANLTMEAAAQAERFAAGGGGEAAAEQLLGEWLDPLRRETEALFERVAAAAGQQPLEASGEAEVNAFLERFAPQPGVVAPEFEDFFKAAFKKLGNIVKTGVNLAKRGMTALGRVLPLGAILDKLKALVLPMIRRVIGSALDRLSPELRPAAMLLGRRLGILREAGGFEAEAVGAATEALEAPAYEFDASVASLMFARDETEMQLLANEEAEGGPIPGEAGPVANLDAARERFVTQFAQLQPGESAAPAIQQFLPAILPALRVALTVVGRQRVVNFLAGHLARLIQKFVGPQAATALARAMVSVGLRAIALEAEAEAAPNEAARALAATLEDTMRRLAETGFEQFDQLDESPEQQRALETLATEAFFQSAIAHFPAPLLDPRRLEEREMMPEMSGEAGVWVYRPKPRYKKYTRVFEVTLTPQAAARIRSFGTGTLATFLRARGVRPPVRVKVHLYEAIPGTVLSRIALLERRVPGLGSGNEAAWSQIHPLTTANAGLLLNEPGLGRDVAPNFLETRHRVGVGQRFFYLELPRAAGPSVTPPRQRPSELNLAIDLRSSQIRVYLYLGETDAQRIVAAGPRVGPETAVQFLVGLQHALTNLRAGPSQHVKLYREMTGELEGEEFWQAALGAAGKRVLEWFLEELGKALLRLLKAAIVVYLNNRLAEFTTATRDPASGVTLVFTFNHPGLRVLNVVLARRLPSMSDARAAIGAIRPPSVAVFPGFRGA